MMENTGHKNNQQDGWVIGVLGVFVVALFVWFGWYQYHEQISRATMFVRSLYELPLYFFIGESRSLSSVFTPNIAKLCQPMTLVSDGSFVGCAKDAKEIKYLELFTSSIFVNGLFGVASICIGFLGMLKFNKHPYSRFKKKHTLESFMKEQQVNYPHLKLFTEFNLQNVNQNSGQLMGMMTTREFAKHHGLVKTTTERVIEFTTIGITKVKKDKLQHVPVVDKEKMVDLCRTQLGDLWVGVDYLTPEEVILLAMYLPRACSVDTAMSDEEFKKTFKELQKFEDHLWEVATDDILNSDQFKPSGVDENGHSFYEMRNRKFDKFDIERYKKDYIEKYLDNKVTQDLLKKHAYTRTFIISVVYTARKLGVLAPCQMRWLKFYNREMWALLQNVGRPSFYSENMGSVSHYQAECVLKRKIFEPNFEVALNGFEYQLQSYKYDKKDFEWFGLDVSGIEVFKEESKLDGEEF